MRRIDHSIEDAEASHSEALPNAWGLYEMHGNVLDWCTHWSGVCSAGAQLDPRGSQGGVSRVLRGG
ncbi:hypothetical protein ACCAA_660044 [Candidatus Accumulibacter aalborgensis]|uniref:Sulfatase-modifying factor enzyme-like domain-containing protein n=1 Tax=Candidatus Accumulibacter aalborgensis TaxID=1860102 RepID=A0A1A8XW99_9PROT|nr:hypothetical protein ACCAA_660044 [Candidatus Accumulibacter aalborgensis]